MKSLISSITPSRLNLLQSILIYSSLALLLLLLCARVWQFGITHTDDARWAMPGYFLGIDPVADWAISQGRIWAYLSGTLILLTLKLQGSVAGEVLRLGSFVLFFVVFYRYLALLVGQRSSLLAATFFLSFFALKWDGSLLTTYPLLTWLAGIAILIALELSARYVRNGRWFLLPIVAILYLFSLINNEGITALFIGLFFAHTCVLNFFIDESDLVWQKAKIRRRSAALLALFFLVSATYAGAYLYWLLSHPSIYDGHKLAGFKLKDFLQTLMHFSTSGSVWHDLFSPYSVPFGDAITMTGERKEYLLTRNLQRSLHDPWSLFACLTTIYLLWTLAKPKTETPRLSAQQNDDPKTAKAELALPAYISMSAQLRAMLGLLFGLSVAIMPIIPVAMTSKYQTWVVESHIQAYSHTIFAHFGWSCVFAVCLLQLVSILQKRWYLHRGFMLSFSLFSGLLASQAFTVNDDIAADMRNESGRWQMVEQFLHVSERDLRTDYVWIPRLASGSWYGSVDPDYWTTYAKRRYGADRQLTAQAPELQVQKKSYVAGDYFYDGEAKRFVALAAQVEASSFPFLSQTGLRIYVQGGFDHKAQSYYLKYTNQAGQEVRQDLSQFPEKFDSGEWSRSIQIDANIASLGLYRRDKKMREIKLCGLNFPRGVSLVLPSTSTNPSGSTASHYVAHQKSIFRSAWSAIEMNGVWTAQQRASLVLPLDRQLQKDMQLALQLNHLAGQVSHIPRQELTVRTKGQVLGKWDFDATNNQAQIEFRVPHQLLSESGELELEFEVTPLVSQLIPSGGRDQRDLGIFLKTITVKEVD